jgi:hypothetical protein
MWLYDNKKLDEFDLSDYIGFVYLITNTIDNKFYIGKKLLKFKKTKTVKGKKKKFLVDSDWKKYWGSNKTLHLDLEELGEEKFTRIVLRMCNTRGELNYYEARYQFDYRVLETDKAYNEWITLKASKSHLKKVDFSDREDIMSLDQIVKIRNNEV